MMPIHTMNDLYLLDKLIDGFLIIQINPRVNMF